MPKKVLIITYYWPPSGGSGVQRWVYFSKYLKKLGEWEPIVLTVEPDKATYPSIDNTLGQEVEDIKVYSTNTIEPFELYKKFTGKKSKQEVPFGHVETKTPLQRLIAFLRGNLFIPDARKYWRKYAFKKAAQLVKTENIQHVITTGPPHSTHLIGLDLKNRFKALTWIVDFRDPWTEIFYNKDLFRTRFTERKDLKLEQQVLRSADKLIAISAFTAGLMSKKLNKEKPIAIIPNGYEPFSIEVEKNETFTISYVGYLGPHHRTHLITEGLKQYIIHTNAEVTLHVAGNIDATILSTWNEIKGLNLINEGFVSHTEAQQIIAASNLILISIPYSDYSLGNIPGKVFECLSTLNPIVLIGQEKSEAAKMIKLSGNTIALEDNETERFVGFLNQVYTGEIKPAKDATAIEKFSRKSLTEALMDKILNGE